MSTSPPRDVSSPELLLSGLADDGLSWDRFWQYVNAALAETTVHLFFLKGSVEKSIKRLSLSNVLHKQDLYGRPLCPEALNSISFKTASQVLFSTIAKLITPDSNSPARALVNKPGICSDGIALYNGLRSLELTGGVAAADRVADLLENLLFFTVQPGESLESQEARIERMVANLLERHHGVSAPLIAAVLQNFFSEDRVGLHVVRGEIRRKLKSLANPITPDSSLACTNTCQCARCFDSHVLPPGSPFASPAALLIHTAYDAARAERKDLAACNGAGSVPSPHTPLAALHGQAAPPSVPDTRLLAPRTLDFDQSQIQQIAAILQGKATPPPRLCPYCKFIEADCNCCADCKAKNLPGCRSHTTDTCFRHPTLGPARRAAHKQSRSRRPRQQSRAAASDGTSLAAVDADAQQIAHIQRIMAAMKPPASINVIHLQAAAIDLTRLAALGSNFALVDGGAAVSAAGNRSLFIEGSLARLPQPVPCTVANGAVVTTTHGGLLAVPIPSCKPITGYLVDGLQGVIFSVGDLELQGFYLSKFRRSVVCDNTHLETPLLIRGNLRYLDLSPSLERALSISSHSPPAQSLLSSLNAPVVSALASLGPLRPDHLRTALLALGMDDSSFLAAVETEFDRVVALVSRTSLPLTETLADIDSLQVAAVALEQGSIASQCLHPLTRANFRQPANTSRQMDIDIAHYRMMHREKRALKRTLESLGFHVTFDKLRYASWEEALKPTCITCGLVNSKRTPRPRTTLKCETVVGRTGHIDFIVNLPKSYDGSTCILVWTDEANTAKRFARHFHSMKNAPENIVSVIQEMRSLGYRPRTVHTDQDPVLFSPVTKRMTASAEKISLTFDIKFVFAPTNDKPSNGIAENSNLRLECLLSVGLEFGGAPVALWSAPAYFEACVRMDELVSRGGSPDARDKTELREYFYDPTPFSPAVMVEECWLAGTSKRNGLPARHKLSVRATGCYYLGRNSCTREFMGFRADYDPATMKSHQAIIKSQHCRINELRGPAQERILAGKFKGCSGLPPSGGRLRPEPRRSSRLQKQQTVTSLAQQQPITSLDFLDQRDSPFSLASLAVDLDTLRTCSLAPQPPLPGTAQTLLSAHGFSSHLINWLHPPAFVVQGNRLVSTLHAGIAMPSANDLRDRGPIHAAAIADNTAFPILSVSINSLSTRQPRGRFNADGSPKGPRDIDAHPDPESWHAAFDTERNAHLRGTARRPPSCQFCHPDDRPPSEPLLNWVCVNKVKSSGLEKSRLTLDGGDIVADKREVTYGTVRIETLRAHLVVAVQDSLITGSCDVSVAFLNGTLKKKRYARHIPCSSRHSFTFFGLKKAIMAILVPIYGLPEAGKIWHDLVIAWLLAMGFLRCVADPYVFIYVDSDGYLRVLLFVDDFFLFSNCKRLVVWFKLLLEERWDTTSHDGIDSALGIQVSLDIQEGTLSLSQQDYALALLERAGMTDCNPVRRITLMPRTEVVSDTEHAQARAYPFREILGGLWHLAMMTRYDLCFAVNYISRDTHKWGSSSVGSLKNTLRYVKGSPDLSLNHTRDTSGVDLLGYSDSSFADCLITRRSTGSHVFVLANRSNHDVAMAISWSVQRLPTVNLSTTGAELYTLSNACAQAVFWYDVAPDIGLTLPGAIPLFEDNIGAKYIAEGSHNHKRVKHMDIRLHWVREVVERSIVTLRDCPSSEMKADLGTKTLSVAQLVSLRTGVGIF